MVLNDLIGQTKIPHQHPLESNETDGILQNFVSFEWFAGLNPPPNADLLQSWSPGRDLRLLRGAKAMATFGRQQCIVVTRSSFGAEEM